MESFLFQSTYPHPRPASYFWLPLTQRRFTGNSKKATGPSSSASIWRRLSPSASSSPSSLQDPRGAGGGGNLPPEAANHLQRETCLYRFELESNSNLIPASRSLLLKIQPRSRGIFHSSHTEERSKRGCWAGPDSFVFLSSSWPISVPKPLPVPL